MTTDPTDALRIGANLIRKQATAARAMIGCEAVTGDLEGYASDLDHKAAQLDELADLMPRLLIHAVILKGRSDNE
jgi:hypothetical protein